MCVCVFAGWCVYVHSYSVEVPVRSTLSTSSHFKYRSIKGLKRCYNIIENIPNKKIKSSQPHGSVVGMGDFWTNDPRRRL